MKINRFKAGGFGCLNGEYKLNPDKVNLIVENNEEGKSTFVDGILAGLYGFSFERKIKDKITEFERLKPWINDSYMIELEVEVNGKTLLIKRDFLKEKVFVYDLLTGKDLSKEYFKNKGYPVGEFLLNILREEFLKTALIRQHEILTIKDPGSITSRLQRIVDTTAGDSTALEAIEILDNALKKYPKHDSDGNKKIENVIKDINKRISEIETELDSLEVKRTAVEKEIEEIVTLSKSEEEIGLEMKKLDYLGKLSEVKELKSQIKEDKEVKKELEKLYNEKDSLEELSDFPADKNDVLLQIKGEISTKSSDIEKEKNELKQIERENEECEKELKSYEEFRAFSENEKKEIERLFNSFKDSIKKIKNKEEEIGFERKKIKRDGFKLEDYNALKDMFDKVSDDDKDFIGDYEKVKYRRDAELKSKIFEGERLEREISEIINLRKSKRKKGIILSSSGIMVLAAGLIFAAGTFYFIPSIIAGLISGIYGFTKYLTANAFKSDIYIDLKNKLETMKSEMESLINEKDKENDKLNGIRKKYNLDDFKDIVEEFNYYKKLDGRTGTLNKKEYECKSTAKETEKIKEDILRYLKKINNNLNISDVTFEYFEKFRNNLKKYFSFYHKKNDLEEKYAEKAKRLESIVKEKEKGEEEIYNILKKCGIEESDVETGIDKYKDMLKNYNIYVKLNDELIPSKEKLLLKNQDINVIQARINVREEEVRKIEKLNPDFRTCEAEKVSSEYYDEFKKKDMELKNIQRKKSGSSESAGAVMTEYQEKYPKLTEELSDLKNILSRAENFQKSVELAVNVLSKISRESHKNWASILNKSVNVILKDINKNYEDLKFDSELNFTIKPKGLDKICSQNEVNYYLSSGAKDQIYLSVRLAVGKYFSQGKSKLPFILDDPFITSDDDRFVAGMNFIISELSKEHQVIILTCHKNRHKQLLRNINTARFDENVEICYLT